MKYKIYADIHRYAPHEIHTDFDYGSNCAYVGDIFDIKNTLKKDIAEAIKDQDWHNKMCQKYKVPNVIGNHDLLNDGDFYAKKNNVLFCHGHLEQWPESLIEEWKDKSREGISWFKYLLVESYSSIKFWNWKPKDNELERFYNKAKEYGRDTVVFGHTHTRELVEVKYKGIKIINVPRGIHILDL